MELSRKTNVRCQWSYREVDGRDAFSQWYDVVDVLGAKEQGRHPAKQAEKIEMKVLIDLWSGQKHDS